MRRVMRSMLAIGLCALLATPQVIAQPTDEPTAEQPAPPAPLAESLTGMAKAEYEAGRILYQDGDYGGAKLKFERAYELSKDARLLWNMAAADKNLRHYASVLRLLQRYQSEGGDALTEQDRQDARALIETVQAFVATLTVNVSQPGAEIRIDDQKVGESPLGEPLLVDMGPRRIRVSKTGYRVFEETRKLAGGEATTVDVELSAEVHEGRLRVVAGVGDTIRVDGKVVGRGQWEGKLPSGAHTLSVSASGKRTYQTDVVIADDQLVTQRVTLEREVAAADAMRDRDSGPPWGWIAAGAALAAGIGVGAYFLFRDEGETRQAGAIPGTIPPGSVQLGVW